MAVTPSWLHGEGGSRGAKSLVSSLPQAMGGAEAVRGAGRWRGLGFSLPLLNRRGCRCRGLSPAGAGGAGLVDTPSPRVFAAGREEAPERRLVLRGAGAPSAHGTEGTPPGPAHAANLACELHPAAWQPQVRRLGAGSLSEPPPWRAPSSLRALPRPPQPSECGPPPNSVGFFRAGSVFFLFLSPVP